MKKFLLSIKIALLLTVLCCSYMANSQDLISSRKSSYYTYIYKITPKEAKEIYTASFWKVDTTFFHTLVDSLPTDSPFTKILPEGHYLKTYVRNNFLEIDVTTVQNFDVFILNNNTDLCVMVQDRDGNVIKDAQVKVNNKKLKYNKQTQSYLDKKSNRKGILSVTYNGFTTYYDLERSYNNSRFKRGMRTLAYNTPVKYVWRPVNFVIHLPIDGIRSIVYGWPMGTIVRTGWFFRNLYNNIACVFDHYYCYDANGYFETKYIDYLVFNKAKYMPGDTVKFKTFIVNRKGKPLNKKVNVFLERYNKSVFLGTLKPYRKGAYEYSFVLHDSLNLEIDRDYDVKLFKKNKKIYAQNYFKFEDYELKRNTLNIRCDITNQYKDTPFKIFAKATDDNELNIMDARLEMYIKPRTTGVIFKTHVYIPDTIFLPVKKLLPYGETEIIIPDSIMPQANFNYDIYFRLLTSDNEAVSTSKNINYFYETEYFDVDILGDSIQFVYKKNGLKQATEVSIFVQDNFKNSKTEVYKGETPCKLKLHPHYGSYIVSNGKITKTTPIHYQNSLLECFTQRKQDSVFIMVHNPLKIMFNYNIYEKDKLIEQAYSDSLNFKLKTSSKETYYVNICYIWGGRVNEDRLSLPLFTKALNIDVEHPKIVYPGQKTKIDVRVTDYKGAPVEGVDLTAFSMTKKFGYTPPFVPFFGIKAKDKKYINSFNIDKDRTVNERRWLNYELWKDKFGLDSIAYYNFNYPENGLYTYSYNTGDNITQFAPFVINKGNNLDAQVIYLDWRPVYFKWSTNSQPYSFKADSGYHRVTIRTRYKLITIDSLYFKQGEKLIVSVDINKTAKNVKIEDVKPELSPLEQRNLYRYIMPYHNTFDERYAYLEQNDNIILLNPSKYSYNNFAGPVSGKYTFHSKKGYSTNFTHEPFFKYEFWPDVLIMRCLNQNTYPKKMPYDSYISSIGEKVLTKSQLEQNWKIVIENKRYNDKNFGLPQYNIQNTLGKLSLELKSKDSLPIKTPLNLLLYKLDEPNFLNIYNGKTTNLYSLERGYYKIIFLYRGALYQVQDSLFIENKGTNYFKFEQSNILPADTFSSRVDKILNDFALNASSYYNYSERDYAVRNILTCSQEEFQFMGSESRTVEGLVIDRETAETIPFANIVIISGGKQVAGTTSDIDGKFKINMPPGSNTIRIGYIGYDIFEHTFTDGLTNDVFALTPNVEMLEIVEIRCYFEPLISKDVTTLPALAISNLNKMPGRSASEDYELCGFFSLEGEMGTIRGARSEGTLTYIDGVQVRGSAGIPKSARSNITILTGGLPANYGEIGGKGMVSIEIPGAQTVYFERTPIFIVNGSVYLGAINQIDASYIEKIEILKDSKSTAPYGESGVNGVVIITTTAGTYMPMTALDKGADYDDSFFDEAMKSSSIRSNFSDYAFWEPKLTTDKDGKASFEVVFPDDVTSWDAYFYAMTGKKQSGFTFRNIKSYKPLMSQLVAPRFLLAADTAYAIGKVLNYTPDSVEVKTQFEINDSTVFTKRNYCTHSIIDTLLIAATSDSVKLKYAFEKNDGYFDGEQININVFPLGLEETKGQFHVLENDTSLHISFDSTLGAVTLYAKAGMLDVLELEIKNVRDYKYLCNEQIASKIKVLLAEKAIAAFKGEKFKSDKEVDKLINLLLKNKTENGFWGWWKSAPENDWISYHVIDALLQAEQQGFKVQLPKIKYAQDVLWKIDNTNDFNTKVYMLKLLHSLAPEVQQAFYITDIEKRNKNLSLHKQLQLIELKQLNNLSYNADTLKHFQKTTLFGNIYFSDTCPQTNLFENDIQNTLLAYRILKRDTATPAETLQKIRNYFFETKKSAYWRNTYEASQIIETILPDIIGDKKVYNKPFLTLSGSLNKSIDTFPFEAQLKATDHINITKTGDLPVYFTAYQKRQNPNPEVKQDDFAIKTYFDTDTTLLLNAGKDLKLIVEVDVNSDAEYVMINVPVPAACSYTEKKSNNHYESHRESYRHETTIFCEKLPKGKHLFEINLIPRYTGSYSLNPAQIQLMYFPVFNANAELKRVEVR